MPPPTPVTLIQQYLNQLPNFIAPVSQTSSQPLHELVSYSRASIEDFHLGDHEIYDLENKPEYSGVREYFYKETLLITRLKRLIELGDEM